MVGALSSFALPNIIHPGADATHGGTAALQVSSAIYGELADFMLSHSALVLEISYDDITLAPNDVTLATTQPF